MIILSVPVGAGFLADPFTNAAYVTHRYYHSSSCGVRSSVTCYQIAHKCIPLVNYSKFRNPNGIVLSIPYNAIYYESALLPTGVHAQYDGLRSEVK
jgi:rhamnogalacturonan endolyase